MTRGNILDRGLVHAGGGPVPDQGIGVPGADLEGVRIQSLGAGGDHEVQDEDGRAQESEGDREVYQSREKKRRKRKKDQKHPPKATAQPGGLAVPAETESEKENEGVEEVGLFQDPQKSQDHPSGNCRGHHPLEGTRKKRKRTKTETEAEK